MIDRSNFKEGGKSRSRNGLRDSECLERGAQKRGTDPKFWASGCRN